MAWLWMSAASGLWVVACCQQECQLHWLALQWTQARQGTAAWHSSMAQQHGTDDPAVADGMQLQLKQRAAAAAASAARCTCWEVRQASMPWLHVRVKVKKSVAQQRPAHLLLCCISATASCSPNACSQLVTIQLGWLWQMPSLRSAALLLVTSMSCAADASRVREQRQPATRAQHTQHAWQLSHA